VQFEGYEVLGELGRGGMGVVARARAADGRDVAIKLLLRPDARQAIERFDRERRLLSSLGEAEGFVPLVDAGVSAQGPYLVMPFVGGGTLRHRLRTGPLPVDEVVALGRALGRALGHAHERGIVHRDLKPENILFTSDGRPLVADLGLAKHFRSDVLGASRSVSLSRAGSATGTAGYMPPEQINDAKSVGPPADVFALGAILYESLTGSAAFEGDSEHALMARVASGKFEPVRSVRRDAPRWLAGVIERALSFEAAHRWKDGRELEAALAAGPRTRSPRPILGAVTVVLALAAGAAVAMRGERAPPPPAAVEQPRVDVKKATPAPVAPPSPAASALPAATASFQRTKLTRLLSVFGRYEWKTTGAVGAIAISPDGTRAAVGCGIYVLVFDVASGTCGAPLVATNQPTRSLAFAPDGKRLLAGSEDGVARLWDLASGAIVSSLTTEGGVRGLDISPDGGRAVTGANGKLVVWDLARGAPIRDLAGSTGRVRSAVFSKDGTRVLSADSYPSVKLWDLTRGEPIWTIPGVETFMGARFREEETSIFVATDTSLLFFDMVARGVPKTIATRDSTWAVALSPDGGRALTGHQDGSLRLWNLASGVEALDMKGRPGWVQAAAFFPDGQRALSGGEDAALRLWDVVRGRELNDRKGEGHSAFVASVAFSRDGKRIATASQDGLVKVWDVATGEETTLAGNKSTPTSVAWSPDGQQIAAGCSDGLVMVWDQKSARVRSLRHGKGSPARAVVFSNGTGTHTGNRLLSGHDDGNVLAWDLTGSSEPERFAVDEHGVTALAFAPDDKTILCGCGRNDATNEAPVKLFGYRGKLLQTFGGRGAAISQVAFSPEGTRAIASSWDSSVALYDLDAKKELFAWEAHGAPFASVVLGGVFVQGGRRALTIGDDGTIKIWDLAARPADRTGFVDQIDLLPTADFPTAVAASPDGRTVAVGTARGVLLRLEIAGD
jgi:WD40 repeat protein